MNLNKQEVVDKSATCLFGRLSLQSVQSLEEDWVVLALSNLFQGIPVQRL